MKHIYVFYSSFHKELPYEVWQEYLKILPVNQLLRNQRYRRWQDRYAHLFGRLLLCHAWKTIGKSGNPLPELQYNNYARPFITGDIDFNITHAGEFVACTIGSGVKLGIDIEQHQDICLPDYSNTMSDAQWNDINNSVNPTETFFNYWTRKEAIIKADGKGLSIPLGTIRLERTIGYAEGNCWFIHQITIGEGYSASLACNSDPILISIEKIQFNGEALFNKEVLFI